jgi:hypothetical protein
VPASIPRRETVNLDSPIRVAAARNTAGHHI